MTTATELLDETKEHWHCPKFEPALWDGKTVTWQDKWFVKDHVTSFLHIPLNFAQVIKRAMAKIEAAGAVNEDNLMLAEESLFGSDLYVATSKEVPSVSLAKLSGSYITKVYEGEYRLAGEWAKQMVKYVQVRGKELKKLYFWYTTCPGCAKKYGKNYVVLFALVA